VLERFEEGVDPVPELRGLEVARVGQVAFDEEGRDVPDLMSACPTENDRHDFTEWITIASAEYSSA
jgi:hypothetical protein